MNTCKKTLGRLAVVISILGLFSCASGPELKNYTQREIDRPFTLPKGVAVWNVPVITGYYRDSSDSVFIPPIPVPLIWEQSLSDDWDLIWAPIPLGLRHQFTKNENYRLGSFLTWGFGYGSVQGFIVNPSLGFSHRSYVGKSWALDIGLAGAYSYGFKSKDSDWSINVGVGPLFQLTDRTALKPEVSVGIAQGFASNIIADDISAGDSTGVTFTPSIAYQWNFSRQWELDVHYSFSGIGLSNDFQAHFLILNFKHLW